jgi:hypothetical protein
MQKAKDPDLPINMILETMTKSDSISCNIKRKRQKKPDGKAFVAFWAYF